MSDPKPQHIQQSTNSSSNPTKRTPSIAPRQLNQQLLQPQGGVGPHLLHHHHHSPQVNGAVVAGPMIHQYIPYSGATLYDPYTQGSPGIYGTPPVRPPPHIRYTNPGYSTGDLQFAQTVPRNLAPPPYIFYLPQQNAMGATGPNNQKYLMAVPLPPLNNQQQQPSYMAYHPPVSNVPPLKSPADMFSTHHHHHHQSNYYPPGMPPPTFSSSNTASATPTSLVPAIPINSNSVDNRPSNMAHQQIASFGVSNDQQTSIGYASSLPPLFDTTSIPGTVNISMAGLPFTSPPGGANFMTVYPNLQQQNDFATVYSTHGTPLAPPSINAAAHINNSVTADKYKSGLQSSHLDKSSHPMDSPHTYPNNADNMPATVTNISTTLKGVVPSLSTYGSALLPLDASSSTTNAATNNISVSSALSSIPSSATTGAGPMTNPSSIYYPSNYNKTVPVGPRKPAILIVNPDTGDSFTPQELAKDVSDRSSVNEFRNKVTSKAFAPDDEFELPDNKVGEELLLPLSPTFVNIDIVSDVVPEDSSEITHDPIELEPSSMEIVVSKAIDEKGPVVDIDSNIVNGDVAQSTTSTSVEFMQPELAEIHNPPNDLPQKSPKLLASPEITNTDRGEFFAPEQPQKRTETRERPANVSGIYRYTKADLLNLAKNVDPNHFPSNLPAYACFSDRRYATPAPNTKRMPQLYDYRFNNYYRNQQPNIRDPTIGLMYLDHKTPVEIPSSENAWVPLNKLKSDMDSEEFETQQLIGKVKALLNKMAPNNFTQLINDFRLLIPNINSPQRATEVVGVIFHKALLEPIYADAYANFLKILANLCQTYKPTSLLLSMAQKEFFYQNNEDRIKKEEDWKTKIEEAKEESERKILEEDYAEFLLKLRDRYLGNIKFISELYKLDLISEGILRECLLTLLADKSDMAYEGLCNLIRFVGKTHAAKHPNSDLIKQFVDVMVPLSTDKNLASRIRYMMIDIIELKQNHWVPRRDEDVPKTFQQIAMEMAQENEENKKIAAAQRKNPKRGGDRDYHLNFGSTGGGAGGSGNLSNKMESPSISPAITPSLDAKNLAHRPTATAQRADVSYENIKLAPASKWRLSKPASASSNTQDSSRSQAFSSSNANYQPPQTTAFTIKKKPGTPTIPPSTVTANQLSNIPPPIQTIKNRFALDTDDEDLAPGGDAVPVDNINPPGDNSKNATSNTRAMIPDKSTEKRFFSYLNDFLNTDADEAFIEGCKELLAINGRLITSPSVLSHIFDQPIIKRLKYPHALVLIIKAIPACTVTDIVNALSDYLNNLEEVVEDYPKIFEYIAEIFLPVLSEAVLQWSSVMSHTDLSSKIDANLDTLTRPIPKKSHYYSQLLHAILVQIKKSLQPIVQMDFSPNNAEFKRVLRMLRQLTLDRLSDYVIETMPSLLPSTSGASTSPSTSALTANKRVAELLDKYFSTFDPQDIIVIAEDTTNPSNNYPTSGSNLLTHIERITQRFETKDHVDVLLDHLDIYLKSDIKPTPTTDVSPSSRMSLPYILEQLSVPLSRFNLDFNRWLRSE